MRRRLIAVFAIAAVAASAGFAPAFGQPSPAAPAFTNRGLPQEPGIGQLPAGASVLIDDGTCPAGQIKKVVGGNVATGQPRLRSCVPRQ